MLVYFWLGICLLHHYELDKTKTIMIFTCMKDAGINGKFQEAIKN